MSETEASQAKVEIIKSLSRLAQQIVFYQDTLRAIAMAYGHPKDGDADDCSCAACVALRALKRWPGDEQSNVIH